MDAIDTCLFEGGHRKRSPRLLPHVDHPFFVPMKDQQSGEHELTALHRSFLDEFWVSDSLRDQRHNNFEKEIGIRNALSSPNKINMDQRHPTKFFDDECASSNQSHLVAGAYNPSNLQGTSTPIAPPAPQTPKIQPAATAIAVTHLQNGLPPKNLRHQNNSSSTRSTAVKGNGRGLVKKTGRGRRNRKCINTEADNSARPDVIHAKETLKIGNRPIPSVLEERHKLLAYVARERAHRYYNFARFLSGTYELTYNRNRSKSKDYVRVCSLKNAFCDQFPYANG